MTLETALTRHAGIEIPLICGAMYPCSNPELVAAVSGAGAIGVVQPHPASDPASIRTVECPSKDGYAVPLH